MRNHNLRAKLATPGIITTGLVMYLDAGNPASYPGSGTVWTDLTGNGVNGTLVNGVGYTASNQGSLVFDGVDDNVTFSSSIPAIGANDFTIACWVLLPIVTPLSCWRAIASLGNGYQTTGGMTLYAPKNTSPANVALAIINTVNPTIVGTSNVNNGAWHYIVLTRGSNTLTLYVDTLAEASVANTASITQQSLIIAKEVNCNSYYQGNIASLAMYNRAFSQADVQQNFNVHRGRYGI